MRSQLLLAVSHLRAARRAMCHEWCRADAAGRLLYAAAGSRIVTVAESAGTGTAARRGLPLFTRDAKIASSGAVDTIRWARAALDRRNCRAPRL